MKHPHSILECSGSAALCFCTVVHSPMADLAYMELKEPLENGQMLLKLPNEPK